MKRFALFVAVVMVAAACASGGETAQSTAGSAPVETTAAPETTDAPVTSQATEPETPETTSAPETTAAPEAAQEGPEAPDFSLALRSGGTFTLSEESKPVYMIFWAEW